MIIKLFSFNLGGGLNNHPFNLNVKEDKLKDKDKSASFFTQMLDLEKRREREVPLKGEKHL